MTTGLAQHHKLKKKRKGTYSQAPFFMLKYRQGCIWINLIKKRFQMFSEALSDPVLVNYARLNGSNTFSRKRKMPLKNMLLCCLSKKGLTTVFELRNYLKEKGKTSM